MGKSIRSKSKRANRTQLRKTFSEPIVQHRTQMLAKKMEKDLSAKRGTSILALRNTLGAKDGSSMDTGKETDTETKEAEEERKLALPLPFSAPLQQHALNPFGHVNSKSKAASPAAVAMQRAREKAIKKDNEQKAIRAKSTKKLEWFK